MPFAGYDDFADCVRKNRDKRDPQAYCAAIKERAERQNVHTEHEHSRVGDGRKVKHAHGPVHHHGHIGHGPGAYTAGQTMGMSEDFREHFLFKRRKHFKKPHGPQLD
jgi:hypothetical protein